MRASLATHTRQIDTDSISQEWQRSRVSPHKHYEILNEANREWHLGSVSALAPRLIASERQIDPQICTPTDLEGGFGGV